MTLLVTGAMGHVGGAIVRQAAQRGIALNKIGMLVQVVERSCVKNVRARFGAIEREHANAILADFAANHWAGGRGGHWRVYFGCFQLIAKRGDAVE